MQSSATTGGFAIATGSAPVLTTGKKSALKGAISSVLFPDVAFPPAGSGISGAGCSGALHVPQLHSSLILWFVDRW